MKEASLLFTHTGIFSTLRPNTVQRLPGPLKGQSGKKNHIWGTYYLLSIGLFDFFYEIKSKELEKKCHETVFTMEEDKIIKLCEIS
jgi:hypothetical protein